MYKMWNVIKQEIVKQEMESQIMVIRSDFFFSEANKTADITRINVNLIVNYFEDYGKWIWS